MRGTRLGLGRRTVVGAALAVLAVGGALTYVTTEDEKERAVVGEGRMTAVTPDQLRAAARARVFFGHQSVGRNLLDAVPAVYAAHGVPAPPLVDVPGTDGRSGGFLADAYLGENTKPLLKLRDFDAAIRGGLGEHLDVALMKFCYLDVDRDTDVPALFGAYRRTLEALRRDYPDVTFLHVTTPLTTGPTFMQRFKGLLGRPTSEPDNAARERYNQLLRAEYGDRLFDLAAIESTTPDGARVGGELHGRPFSALYDGYASDSGHLDARAAAGAAGVLLAAIATAAGR
jgi:hypothetical protein